MDKERRTARAATEFRLDLWARGLRWLLIALAVVATGLGFAAGVDSLYRFGPDLPAMVPQTAAGIVALAAAGLLETRHRRLSQALSALVVVGATAAILLPVVYGAPVTAGGDRVSLATAIGLLLAAAAGLLGWVPRVGVGLREFFATSGVVLSLVAVDGYVFDAQALLQMPIYEGLSPQTVFGLLVLNVAILLARPDGTWVGELFGRGPGSVVARWGLPLALAIPVALSYIALRVTEAGLLNANTRLAVLSIVIASVAGVVVLRSARFRNAEHRRTREEEIRLKQVLDGIETAVFMVPPNGRVVGNRSAEMYARSAGGIESLLSRAPLTPLDDQPGLATADGVADWLANAPFHSLEDRAPLTGASRPMARLLAGDGPGGMFAGYLDETGAERALHFRVSRYLGQDGEPIALISVTDETEGWTLREKLARQDRLDAMAQLSGGIAHEIGNILGSVRLSADTALLTGGLAASTERQFSTILRACDRGAELTRRLLTMAKEPLVGGKTEDAVAVLRDAVELFSPSLSARIALESELPQGLVALDCAEADLGSGVLNLLLNARNAMKESGRGTRIRLTATVADRMLSIEVADDGPGMNPRHLARAREPFFTTRRDHGGTGMGLAVTAAVAERLGGSFDLTSEPGVGTVARLRLPLSGTVTPTDAPAEDVREVARLEGVRILLVDDDEQFLDTTAEALALIGAEVTRAADAESALAELDRAAGAFDVLVTDVVMPGSMDGFALAERMAERFPSIRPLFLSGYSDFEGREGRGIPGILLRKPVALPALANAVRITMSR
ncbi:response regulator [Rhodobacterales bacterium HKCCE2091]|nr:response regulator [Rhodobacterales bacterium HKCCE2091]